MGSLRDGSPACGDRQVHGRSRDLSRFGLAAGTQGPPTYVVWRARSARDATVVSTTRAWPRCPRSSSASPRGVHFSTARLGWRKALGARAVRGPSNRPVAPFRITQRLPLGPVASFAVVGQIKRTLTLAGEQRALVMDVLVLIDTLDDLVHNAKPIPLTDQVRMDKEGIYDILDQIRATIPDEIKQARWIVKERQEMQAEATREAERIVKEASEREEHLISDDEVTKQAERAAADIIEDARGREREILLGAEDYADEILNTLEVNLSRFNAAVQRCRDRLERKDASAEIG